MVKRRWTYSTLMILLAVLVVSCVPSTGGGGKRNSSVSTDTSSSGDVVDVATTSGTTTGNSTGGSTTPNIMNWYTTSTISGDYVIAQDTTSSAYVRGQSINTYLYTNDYNTKKHCFLFQFSYGGSGKKFLAVSAFHSSFSSSSSTERAFRLDIGQKETNEFNCKVPSDITVPAEEGQVSFTIESSSVAHTPTEICPGCITGVTSIKTFLFETEQVDSTDPSQGRKLLSPKISKTLLDVEELNLQVEPASTVSNPGTGSDSCSDSSCKLQGFDCCYNGIVCVDDLTPKITSDDAGWDEYQNLLNLYERGIKSKQSLDPYAYICSTGTTTGTSTTGTTTGGNDKTDEEIRQELLDKLEQDSICISEAEEATPVYTSCRDANIDSTSNTQADYFEIKKEMYEFCGCPNPDFGTSNTYLIANKKAKNCDYEYELVKTNNVVTDVLCKVPEDDVFGFQPIEDLQVSVKTAPHRYFKQDGSAVDDIETLDQSNTADLQEGTDSFLYLAPVDKEAPIQSSFSMKSILGPFEIDLGYSRPAEVITVETGNTYVIESLSLSANFSLCEKCDNDAWLEQFSAFPSANKTNTSYPIIAYRGVEATGFTTRRDILSDNHMRGNFEDTKFARACFVPPTMLPFSHAPRAGAQDQRLARLKTQAALFANGYKRDWFGFNLGAPIASFDGVKWFAIGDRRKVTATSNKLFIAINAPFRDLSTNHFVRFNIKQSDGAAAAEYDYNPDGNNAVTRNQGASCQKYHYCETDSDCVSQLGWEYTCGDPQDYKSLWPKFDINADERSNESSSFKLSQIIFSAYDVTKNRCFYRGAGSPCIKSTHASGINADQEKLLTCAPNFYCQDIGTAGSPEAAFNDKVTRTPVNIASSIKRGMGAKVLGRQEDYLLADNGLDAEIIANVEDNFININASLTAASGNIGFCMPGKDPAGTQDDKHVPDDGDAATTDDYIETVTDYVNQIAGCEPSVSGVDRVRGCPVIGSDGNYKVDATNEEKYAQNMCGNASVKDGGTASNIEDSSFFSYELDTLLKIASFNSQKIAAHACLRRAGSPCMTDLECGPNRLHADSASVLSKAHFGGTDAEKNYWLEYLVCSQESPRPALGSDEYEDYDLTYNRCCRETGGSFTMAYELDMVDSAGTAITTLDKTTKEPDSNGTIQTPDLSIKYSNNEARRYSRYSNINPKWFDEPLQVNMSGQIVNSSGTQLTDSSGTGLTYSSSQVRAGASAYTEKKITANKKIISNSSLSGYAQIYRSDFIELLYRGKRVYRNLSNNQVRYLNPTKTSAGVLVPTGATVNGSADISIGTATLSEMKFANGIQYDTSADLIFVLVAKEDHTQKVDIQKSDGTSGVDGVRETDRAVESYHAVYLDTDNDGKEDEMINLPVVEYDQDNNVWLTKTRQWHVYQESGKNNCCGGGWVRKFADGTNDWTKSSFKLDIPYENFKCLNYANDYVFNNPGENSSYWEKEINYYCQDPDPAYGSCSEVGMTNDIESVSTRAPLIAGINVTPYDVTLGDLDIPYKPYTAKPASLSNGYSLAVNNTTSDIAPAMDINYMPRMIAGDNANQLESTGRRVADLGPWAPAPLRKHDDETYPYFDIGGESLGLNRIGTWYIPSYLKKANLNHLSVAWAFNGGSGDMSFHTWPEFNTLGFAETMDFNPFTTDVMNSNDINEPAVQFCDQDTNNDGAVNMADEFFCHRLGPFIVAINFSGTDQVINNVLNGTDDVAVPSNTIVAFCHNYSDGALTFEGNYGNDASNDTGLEFCEKQVSAAYITMNFYPSERPQGTTSAASNLGMFSGNLLYYAEKLEKFELLGVPQITYEPLMCNSDRSKIVEGFFKGNSPSNGMKTSDLVSDHTEINPKSHKRMYGHDNPNGYTYTKEEVSLPDIFSPDEFTCCQRLGQQVESASECCTGYAVNGICKIPQGTNLSVYFNRFISSEGHSDFIEDGLEYADFDDKTGFPLNTTEVSSKVQKLGREYCATGQVRLGGAFGSFAAQPYPPGVIDTTLTTDSYLQTVDYFVLGIIDTKGDSTYGQGTYGIPGDIQSGDPLSENGYRAFERDSSTNFGGYRWNNHWYCL